MKTSLFWRLVFGDENCLFFWAVDIPVLFYLGNRSICCCSRHSCLCGKHHRSTLSAAKTAFSLFPFLSRGHIFLHNLHIKSPSLQPADVSEDEVRVVGGLGTGHERAGDLSAGDIGRTNSGLRSRRSRGE